MDGVWSERRAEQSLKRFRQPMRRHRTEMLAVIGYQGTMNSPAEAARLFEDCIENRHQIARRRIDDLQYLGGSGLLVERLVPLGGAFVELSLEFGNRPLEIGYCPVERLGHVPTPSRHPRNGTTPPTRRNACRAVARERRR